MLVDNAPVKDAQTKPIPWTIRVLVLVVVLSTAVVGLGGASQPAEAACTTSPCCDLLGTELSPDGRSCVAVEEPRNYDFVIGVVGLILILGVMTWAGSSVRGSRRLQLPVDGDA